MNSNYRRCRARSSRPVGYSISTNIGKQLREICVFMQQTDLPGQWDNTLHVVIPASSVSKRPGSGVMSKTTEPATAVGSYSRGPQDRGIKSTWVSRDGILRIFF